MIWISRSRRCCVQREFHPTQKWCAWHKISRMSLFSCSHSNAGHSAGGGGSRPRAPAGAFLIPRASSLPKNQNHLFWFFIVLTFANELANKSTPHTEKTMLGVVKIGNKAYAAKVGAAALLVADLLPVVKSMRFLHRIICNFLLYLKFHFVSRCS